MQITDPVIGLTGIVLLFVLILLRVPVAVAMLAIGAGGIYCINPRAALPTLAGEFFNISSLYSLTILPLFILMGNLARISGMSRDLYNASHAWFGHFRGGLASSTIAGCACFSALSGSSVASAVTMGRVALPEMQRYGYDNTLSTGTVAAGGTLGILIPPSAGFVIVAILTEESVGRLFMAGVLPGILLSLLFVLAIYLRVYLVPEIAPISSENPSFQKRLRSLWRAGWIFSIIFITIGGIYAGVFTAIEAAGIGCFLTMLIALTRGALSWDTLQEVMHDTLRSTGMIFFILAGAFVFMPFMALSGVPVELLGLINQLGVGKYSVLLIIIVVLILLGTFLEGFAILVLTLPLVQPVIESYGFDMIWFGVVMVLVLEMGLISPPVGINVFVVRGIAPHVSMRNIYKGIIPFWFAIFIAIGILILVPEIALFLPDTMFN